VLLRAFDEMVLQQSRFVPAGALVEGDYHKRQACVGPHQHVVRGGPSGGGCSSRATDQGAHRGRERPYVFVLTRTCALTAAERIVPVGVADARVGAAAAAGALSREAARAAGLLWCTNSEAAALAYGYNDRERRKKGQRIAALPASTPSLQWALALPCGDPSVPRLPAALPNAAASAAAAAAATAAAAAAAAVV
jgi:hypothetical protein